MMLRSLKAIALVGLLSFLTAGMAAAQWSPKTGQWGKKDPALVRVMTWNVFDHIRTSEPKVEGSNAWTALARTVAAFKPEVLVLQETGDNGCICVDSVADLTTVLDLFLHGGTDPFLGGPVTAYVQKYDPSFDMPSVYVSARTNGRDRNAVLSVFPFQDLNGDGKSLYDDAFVSTADAYAPGTATNPIAHGLLIAELDLPDAIYRGDLVIMSGHLAPGSGAVPMAKRLASAQNWAYLIDYWYNGAGTGVPDPSNVIDDVPAATRVLSPQTAIISAGDWNEDETTNGRKGPAEWITSAEFSDSVGGVDGTDADRSDALYDDSRDPCNSGNRGTQGLAKVDYIAWQDSIATRRLQVIFDSATVGAGCNNAFPPELLGFPVPAQASSIASDHLPVIVDVSLPCGNPGLTTFRNGSGLNPPCLASQAPPIVGQVWSVTVDGSSVPGATSTFVRGHKSGLPGTQLAFGELFIDLSSRLLFSFAQPGAGPTVHEIQVPNTASLAGFDFVIQGGVRVGGVLQTLCNAEDCVIGCP